MIPAKIAANIKKGHIFILSAIVPETIETVVAQKTIWKNQSECAAYPVAISSAAANEVKLPMYPPSGIP